jgi:hypothetical protein
MAVSRVQLSSIKQGFPKSRSFLDGNTGYVDTSATWLIQRINPTGSSATVTFSSIPQTYSSLQIRVMGSAGYGSNNSTQINCAFNGDTTGTNYYTHALYGNAFGGVNPNAFNDRTLLYLADTPATTSLYGVGIVDIHDYASTTKYKTSRSFSGFDFNSSTDQPYVTLSSMLWKNTAAITSLSLTAVDANWTSGSTIALYGMK